MIKSILIYLINLYGKYISPYKIGKCKYFPTCSAYTVEAINKHGAFKGFFIALKRVLKCNPFSKGGYDPLN